MNKNKPNKGKWERNTSGINKTNRQKSQSKLTNFRADLQTTK